VSTCFKQNKKDLELRIKIIDILKYNIKM